MYTWYSPTYRLSNGPRYSFHWTRRLPPCSTGEEKEFSGDFRRFQEISGEFRRREKNLPPKTATLKGVYSCKTSTHLSIVEDWAIINADPLIRLQLYKWTIAQAYIQPRWDKETYDDSIIARIRISNHMSHVKHIHRQQEIRKFMILGLRRQSNHTEKESSLVLKVLCISSPVYWYWRSSGSGGHWYTVSTFINYEYRILFPSVSSIRALIWLFSRSTRSSNSFPVGNTFTSLFDNTTLCPLDSQHE